MMKKICLLVLMIVLGKISYGQYPISQNLGSDSTIVVSKGATQSRFVNVVFADTATANNQRIRQYPGAQIVTTSGGLNFWIRNASATGWLPVAIGSGNNIYTINGTLTGARTLTGGGYPLTFTGLDKFVVSADSIRFTTGDLNLLMNTDSASISKKISYAGNYHSDYKQFTLVDKGYVDSVVSSSPAGTVTSIATNNATGITGGTITSTGTLAIDTTNVIATKASVTAGLAGKLNISDTAAMLTPYLRAIDTTSLSNRINLKLNISDTASMLSPYARTNAVNAGLALKVNISDTASMLTPYLRKVDTASLSNRINLKLNISDTASMLSPYARTNAVNAGLALKVNISDTSSMLLPYLRKIDTASLSNRINLKVNISDTASMLSPYLRSNVASATYVPQSRTITINGTSQDLSANRTFSVGTVTSVGLTAGTGISVSGSPVTGSGSMTVTNTAPDQTVVLNSGTGISISGTYPSFTITNSSPSSGGTVTSVGTNNGTGLTGGTITTAGTLAIDTALISTRLWRQKGIDSVQSNLTAGLALKVNISDTSSMLSPYLRKIDTTAMLSPYARKNFINAGTGISYSSSTGTIANTAPDQTVALTGGTGISISGTYPNFTITNSSPSGGGTVTSVGSGTGLTGGPITTSGTLAVDTLLMSTRAWRQKGIDSVQANLTAGLSLKLNISDTANMLSPYLRKVDTTSLSNRINLKLNISDTSSMLTNYFRINGVGLNRAGQTVLADTLLLSTRAWRQKGIDSVASLITSGYVPYTGATTNVDLGTHTLTAKNLVINHASGSGVAASITKGGNGEALTISKTSGSGNAMSVSGGLTSLVDLSLSSISNATTDTDRFLVSDGGVVKYRTGAEVLSDIGGQAALTNPVTGTGTTNRLAKFTASGTIGNGSIADSSSSVAMTISSGGNLGLGVTPSAWGLGKAIEIGNIGNAIWGVNATQYNIIQNAYYDNGYKYASSNAASYYQQSGGNHTWYNAPAGTAGNAISFTGAMTLIASGNLGLGTATIGSKLQVNGNAAIGYSASTAAPTNGLLVSGNTAIGSTTATSRFSVGNKLLMWDGTPTGASATTTMGYTFNNSLSLPSGLVIEDATGIIVSLGNNVGQIGTRNNSYVGGIFRLDGRAAKQEFIVLGVPTGAATEFDRIGINLQNGNTILAPVAGNVGIGIAAYATMGSKLQVNGNAAIGYSASTAAPTNGLAVSGSVGIGTTTPDSLLTVNLGTRLMRGVRMSGLPTAPGTRALRVDANGTLSVSDTLANGISGSGTTNYIPKFTSSSAIGNSIVSESGASLSIAGSVTAGGYTSVIAKSGTGVESINLLTLQTTGTGAIGDSLNIRFISPQSYNIANISAILGGDDVAYGSLAFSTRNYFTDNMVEVMRINNRGNVGINTTTIGSRLQVNGNAAIGYSASTSAPTDGLAVSGDVGIGTTSPSTKFHVVGSSMIQSMSATAINIRGDESLNSNFGITWTTPTYTGGLAAIRVARRGASDASDMMFFTAPNGDNPTERMRITSGGDVGIGTTSPAVKLDVNGDVRTTSKYAWGTATNGTTGQIATDNTNNYFDYLGALIFRTAAASSEKMRLDASGNLGIGTTSPNSLLHVAGSLRLPIAIKTATYTLDASDYTVVFDLNGNATANLPDATTIPGRIYVIKINRTSVTDTLTIDPNGAQTIDGNATLDLLCQQAITIQSDGTNWRVIGDYLGGLNCL